MNRTASAQNLYFVTLTVVDWIDLFTRKEYKDFIIENIKYCIEHKNLEVGAYVIMTNHIHMLAASKKQKPTLGDILRDFKSFTSKGLSKMILENSGESRKEWLLPLFKRNGDLNPLN